MTDGVRWTRRRGKRPITVSGAPASSTDRSTWSTYRAARKSIVGDGLGIMLGAGLGCLDLDHCIDGGRLAPWAQAILEEWRTRAIWVEVSMSGEGLHIFVPLAEARGSMRWGVTEDGAEWHLEQYSRARFIAVTGNEWRQDHGRT